jgi:L-malate glycosyltransferase
VSTSDHEGFCVPLLEAMYHRVPVVAYAAAAVPETVGDAGVLLASRAPALLAAAWHRAATDDDVRVAMQAAGTARLGAFALDVTSRRLLDALARRGVGAAP